MKTILILLGSICLISASHAQDSSIDTAAADNSSSSLEAIIEERAKDIVYVPADRPKPDFQVQEKRSFKKTGHTITYNRVAPPAIAQDEVVYKEPRPVVIPESFLEAHKEHLHFHFFATVMDKQVTEISWHTSGEKFSILVNADLSFLNAMGSFETEDKRFTIFGFMGSGPISEEVEGILARDPFVEGIPIQYIVTSPESVSDEMLAHENFDAVDALLSHYESNKELIWESFVCARARGKAYKDYKEANPPSPDVQINFWKIED